jgi:hypothetical protein
MHEAGKGDKPRPIIDKEKFNANWDAIFKNKETLKFFEELDKNNERFTSKTEKEFND